MQPNSDVLAHLITLVVVVFGLGMLVGGWLEEHRK